MTAEDTGMMWEGEDTGMMWEVCNGGERQRCVACDLRRADDDMKQGEAVG